MIKTFKVKNFKNFKEELVLDLSRSREYDFNTHLIKNGLINKMLIYGPNNSGKSNLGAAIMDITTHLTDNYGVANPLYIYYANGYYVHDPVRFEYVFVLNDHEVTYRYEKYDNRRLLREELYDNNDLLFKYSYLDNSYENNIPEAASLDLSRRNNDVAVLKYIYSNVMYWPEDSTFSLFMNFVNNMLWFRNINGNEYMGVMPNGENLHDFILNNRLLGDFQSFLKRCGQDYSLCEIMNNGKNVIGVKYKDVIALFDIVASSGTKTLLLFYYWMHRTNNISFMFLDEFDAYYHYELAAKILNEVNSRTDFQSILTSHNVYLIDNGIMRPDCYSIINNGKISSFSDRSKRAIRKAQNLEKMMLGGEFDK